MCMSPQPWARTGPGTASDGKPKFDLAKLDQRYFDRLRDRIVTASRCGIYVSVMLFDGFALHLTATPDNVEGHPFHARNNVYGVAITSIRDYQVLPLEPSVQALQEAYIRKVVDTVHDLPNVLYEVANESSGDNAESVTLPNGSSIDTPIGDSTQWQYWVINFVKRYEEAGYDAHPVGMTMQYPVPDQRKVNHVLFASPADWISPGFDESPSPDDLMGDSVAGRWLTDPPANDGRKVILTDTDHYSPMQADALWAWKSFLRGHNPLLYDLAIFAGPTPADSSAGTPSYASLEPARYAMGDTLRFAQRIRLAEMEPQTELSSTKYVPASRTGSEFLVLQPEASQRSFTVELPAGRYSVEWYSVESRNQVPAESVAIETAGKVTFKPPRAEAVILLLQREPDRA